MKFNNKVYDILKWVTQIVLPAFGTLYFGLAQIWGFPYTEQVIGTITAVDAFLGIMLGISSYSYDGEGTITVDMATGDSDIDLETDDWTGNSKMVAMKIIKKPVEEVGGNS